MKHRSVYRLKLAVCMLLTATGGVKVRESDVVVLVLGGTVSFIQELAGEVPNRRKSIHAVKAMTGMN